MGSFSEFVDVVGRRRALGPRGSQAGDAMPSGAGVVGRASVVLLLI